MATGASANLLYIPETAWGAWFSTVKAATLAGATSITLNGIGGSQSGTLAPAAGMYLYFNDFTGEAPKLISNVVTGTGDAVITVPALTYAHAADAKCFVGLRPNLPTAVEEFEVERKTNNWSATWFDGTRAASKKRKKGRHETSGSMSFMLSPIANQSFMVNSVGRDLGVTGTAVGGGGNSTLNGAVAAGATTAVLAAVTNFAINDFVQIGTGATAEVRKITNIATNTLTLDTALKYNHLTAEAAVEVQAPFTHNPEFGADLNSYTLAFYAPFDNASNSNGLTTKGYYVTGAKLFKGGIESGAESGIKASLSFDSQNLVINDNPPAVTPLTNAQTEVYSFDQIAVLFDGTRTYRVGDFKVDWESAKSDKYVHNGTLLPGALKAGSLEVSGEFSFLEDEATQLSFWQKWEQGTVFSLEYMIKDSSTGYYTDVKMTRCTVDGDKDSGFSPDDMVDAKISWTAELDSTTGKVMQYQAVNGDYLPY